MPETTEMEKTTAAPAPAPDPAPVPPKPRKKRKIKKWIFLGLLLAAGGFAGYNAIQAAGAKSTVQYDQALVQDIDSTLSVSGTITPSETKQYFVPGSVKVAKVNFRQGDQVQKGDVIATFDLSDLNLSLQKAKLTLENAQLQYDDTMNDLDNSTQELYDLNKEIRRIQARETTYKLAYDYFHHYPTKDEELDRIISAYKTDEDDEDDTAMYNAWQEIVEELSGKIAQRRVLRESDLSENNQKVLDNNLELQKLEYEEIARLISQSQGGIVADFDGIITQLDLVEGAAVSAGQPAVTLASTEGVLLRFSVGKYDVDRMEVGQTAEVTFGGKKLTGTVTRMDGAATVEVDNNTTNTVLKGEITIDDPDHVLKLGMDANGEILTAQAFGAVAVPVEAVKVDRDGEYLYTVTPCTQGEAAEEGLWELRKTYVKTGIFDDAYIQVLEGLSAGDAVCPVLAQELPEGTLVNAIPTGAAAQAAAEAAAAAQSESAQSSESEG